MGKLTQPTANGIVFAVVERVGEVVTPADRVFAVVGAVGFVGDQVDLAQQFLLVVLEFADHRDDLSHHKASLAAEDTTR